MHNAPAAETTMSAKAWDVFLVFLRLGLTSFGGPIAHLAYFRDELVARRQWLEDAEFARLVALCQFLPGPASSQLGFALGLRRAGWKGALGAFVGFTLPSALAMACIALYLPAFGATEAGLAVVHGLKLVAVVVVAHGLWGMARSLTPDLSRIGIGLLTASMTLAWPSIAGQLAAISVGAILGLLLCRCASAGDSRSMDTTVPKPIAIASAALFLVGLAWSLLPRGGGISFGTVAAAHYQAGALVFGGGHVVLPLLDARLVDSGLISADQFLAGYGAAQAMPGPMFTLASYLGAAIPSGSSPLLGSAIATICIFLPGFLILVATLPLWTALHRQPRIRSAAAGVSAAVVGLLLSTLYRPLWMDGVNGWQDVLIVAVGLVLCGVMRKPILVVLPWCVVAEVMSRMVL